MRSVKCTNHTTGFSMTFGDSAFSPFFLMYSEGIYSTENKVYISDNIMTDGGTYQGTVARTRNIILVVMPKPENMIYNLSDRDALRLLFKKGETGTLIYTENGVSRKIEYVTESIERSRRGSHPFTISLLCPNPMFTDLEPTTVSMSNWLDGFEFPHEFPEEEEFGTLSAVRSVNIVNDVATDNIGMTITINVSGTVTNPKITRIESDESICIGSASKPFEINVGDVIKITTGRNDKHVRRIRNGETVEVNEYLTEDSEFIQLMYGNNNITYSATTGESYMAVDISYAFEYEGM